LRVAQRAAVHYVEKFHVFAPADHARSARPTKATTAAR
jgi:hypothetical protein